MSPAETDERLHETRAADIWRAAFDSDDLKTVLAALYRQEINVGMQSFWDGGWEVWFGDDMNGKRQTETFANSELDALTDWLKTTAEQIYPVLRRRRLGVEAYV